MPLLGAPPATQFCTVSFGRARDRAPKHSARRSAKPSPNSIRTCRLIFAGTPAQFHNEILLAESRDRDTLFAIFGVVAFMLSGVGLYGVMSFSVNQRTQEFGIRMALGADARRILRMVMSQGAWQLAHRACARRRRHCAASRRARGGCAEKYPLQGQSARSDHLLRRRGYCSLWWRHWRVLSPRVAPPASIRWLPFAMNDLRDAFRIAR